MPAEGVTEVLPTASNLMLLIFLLVVSSGFEMAQELSRAALSPCATLEDGIILLARADTPTSGIDLFPHHDYLKTKHFHIFTQSAI